MCQVSWSLEQPKDNKVLMRAGDIMPPTPIRKAEFAKKPMTNRVNGQLVKIMNKNFQYLGKHGRLLDGYLLDHYSC